SSRAVTPMNLVRLGEFGGLLDPVGQALVRCAHANFIQVKNAPNLNRSKP
ncbi:hypothetical protein MNBD_GAMMA02-176, partial [hydrothermal vent metagenome]